MYHIDEVLKVLKKFLKENPKYISKVLSLCVDFMDEYESSVKKERESKAYNAISMSSGFYSLPENKKAEKEMKREKTIPMLIDSMEYLFPNGYKKSMACTGDKNRLHKFLDVVIEEQYLTDHKDWLLLAKGQLTYNWLEKITNEYTEDVNSTKI